MGESTSLLLYFFFTPLLCCSTSTSRVQFCFDVVLVHALLKPSSSMPSFPFATPQGHKRETLYDIARRVPVSVMREYFNFSLRQAADVS